MNGLQLSGEVVKGRQAASGLQNTEDGIGTISLQKPFFISEGVKRAECLYSGTININIAPKEFQIKKPDYTITAEWTPGIIETFWLVDVVLEHKGEEYPAYLYYPCPSMVKAHPDSLIEILTERIPDLAYGDAATIMIPEGLVSIKK